MDGSDHLGKPVKISVATGADKSDWIRLRRALWPDGSQEEHEAEITDALLRPGETLNLIARDGDGRAVGMAEASLRHDYVNGCDSSPVAFLEGIYVVDAHRRQGIAGQMVKAAELWAEAQGCLELASDTDIDNTQSQALHASLGFVETQRVVYFRKLLPRSE